jgi:hypothetical protein
MICGGRQCGMKELEYPSKSYKSDFYEAVENGEDLCVRIKSKYRSRLARKRLNVILYGRDTDEGALQVLWATFFMGSFYIPAFRAHHRYGYDIHVEENGGLKVKFIFSGNTDEHSWKRKKWRVK